MKGKDSMLNIFSKNPMPKTSGNEPQIVRLEQYLRELSDHLKNEAISEIYIHGIDRDDEHGETRDGPHTTLQWSGAKVSSFISELAWECRVRIDPFRPYAGGVLPGLSWRWHAVIAPMSPGSPMVVLRKQKFEALSLCSFDFENTSPQGLISSMSCGVSIVIFGATRSGKTTLLISLLRQFFSDVRLGIAEVVEEIPLFSKQWFRMVEVPPDAGGRGGVSMTKVLSEMMRLSPKFIAIGEVRGDEARVIADIARTGHGGVITTFHAGGFEDARIRLATLAGLHLSQFPPLCGVKITQKDGMFTVRSEMLN